MLISPLLIVIPFTAMTACWFEARPLETPLTTIITITTITKSCTPPALRPLALLPFPWLGAKVRGQKVPLVVVVVLVVEIWSSSWSITCTSTAATAQQSPRPFLVTFFSEDLQQQQQQLQRGHHFALEEAFSPPPPTTTVSGLSTRLSF